MNMQQANLFTSLLHDGEHVVANVVQNGAEYAVYVHDIDTDVKQLLEDVTSAWQHIHTTYVAPVTQTSIPTPVDTTPVDTTPVDSTPTVS